MLIAFVALIIRNRMYTKIKDAEEEMLERQNYVKRKAREISDQLNPKVLIVREGVGMVRGKQKISTEAMDAKIEQLGEVSEE